MEGIREGVMAGSEEEAERARERGLGSCEEAARCVRKQVVGVMGPMGRLVEEMLVLEEGGARRCGSWAPGTTARAGGSGVGPRRLEIYRVRPGNESVWRRRGSMVGDRGRATATQRGEGAADAAGRRAATARTSSTLPNKEQLGHKEERSLTALRHAHLLDASRGPRRPRSWFRQESPQRLEKNRRFSVAFIVPRRSPSSSRSGCWSGRDCGSPCRRRGLVSRACPWPRLTLVAQDRGVRGRPAVPPLTRARPVPSNLPVAAGDVPRCTSPHHQPPTGHRPETERVDPVGDPDHEPAGRPEPGREVRRAAPAPPRPLRSARAMAASWVSASAPSGGQPRPAAPHRWSCPAPRAIRLAALRSATHHRVPALGHGCPHPRQAMAALTRDRPAPGLARPCRARRRIPHAPASLPPGTLPRRGPYHARRSCPWYTAAKKRSGGGDGEGAAARMEAEEDIAALREASAAAQDTAAVSQGEVEEERLAPASAASRAMAMMLRQREKAEL
ncbi:hypothetical protein ZWY2020_028958 [Hordeum vulgare]|nr:hypothetical protein ZWY2020_028958 [Hordeum vulgare]